MIETSDRRSGRVLYFDIDGVLLDYDDQPKPALVGGPLEARLKALGFERLVCVSGWSDMLQASVARIPADEQPRRIHRMLEAIFPDREWFLERLELTNNTDHRCEQIDRDADWYYADDWADKFFTAQFGEEAYGRFFGNRVLLASHRSDGSDRLEWLDWLESILRAPVAPARSTTYPSDRRRRTCRTTSSPPIRTARRLYSGAQATGRSRRSRSQATTSTTRSISTVASPETATAS